MSKSKISIRSVVSALSWEVLLASLLAVLLVSWTRLHYVIIPNFVTIHTILEFACIAIGMLIFTLQYLFKSHNLFQRYQILGIPFLGIAILDLLHTISFRGMPNLINENTPQKSIAFWLAARFLEAIAFLAFAVYSRYQQQNRLRAKHIYGILALYIGVVAGYVFYYPEMIPTFADYQGKITDLKVNLEYGLMILHFIIVWFLYANWRLNNVYAADLITASLLIAISGLTFSSFSDVHDIVIFLGHLLKTIAYFYIFRGCLVNEILEPYFQLISLNKELKKQRNQLLKLQMKLQHAERLSIVGQSLTSIIHDLSNMLTVTEISAKTILDISLNKEDSYEPIRRYSQMIVKSLNKAKTFHHLILEKSKAAPSLEARELNLCFEIENVEPLLQAIVGSEIELKISCPGDLKLHMNLFEFEQIIMNLIVNAKDALAEKNLSKIDLLVEKINIQNQTQSIEGPIPYGEYIKISVSDNGTGIAPEVLPNIFGHFFTTKEGSKGTGIGLATVKELVEKWKGFIVVETKVNQGTKFILYFSCTEKS